MIVAHVIMYFKIDTGHVFSSHFHGIFPRCLKFFEEFAQDSHRKTAELIEFIKEITFNGEVFAMGESYFLVFS